MKKYLTEFELLDLLTVKKNHTDFVAFCITPWHLLGIKAYLQEMSEKKRGTITGFLIIMPHQETGFALDAENINFAKEINVEIYYRTPSNLTKLNHVKDIYNLLRMKVKEIPSNSDILTDMYIISPNRPKIKFASEYLRRSSRNVECIVVDEGASTYLDNVSWLKHIFIETKSIRSIIHQLISRLLQTVLKSKTRISVRYYTIFLKEKKKLIENIEAIQGYSNHLHSNKMVTEIKNSKYALIITQPPVRGLKSYESITWNMYGKIIRILKNKGYDVLVKPHPRDNLIDKYKDFEVEILDSKMAIEYLYPTLTIKPRFIVGTTSTALVMLPLFYEVESVSVLPLLLKEMCKKPSSDEKFFMQKFAKSVRKIKSYSDFEEIDDFVRNYER